MDDNQLVKDLMENVVGAVNDARLPLAVKALVLENVLRLGTRDSYGTEQLQILPGEDWQGLVITATFVTPDSNGGPYFSLLNSNWQSIGNWRMDDDGRGHLTTPIIELEKLKTDGVSYTAQWVYMSGLGRYVLCAK